MKNAIVIGAAGGVGLEVAKALLSQGWNVTATVLNEAEERMVKDGAPGVKQVAHVDLGNPDDALAKLKDLAKSLDTIERVAVCAAISPLGPVELTPLSVVKKTLEINLISHVAIYQAVIGKLRESKGRLVFISSMSGKISMPFIGAYTASKFGLEGIADIMRQESAPFGVEISLVEPGGIKTGMVKDQIELVARKIAELTPEQDKLYGHLYRGFQKAASESYNGNTGSSGADVAKVLMKAFDDPKPATRYIAGADAEQLLGARASMDDRQMDGLFADFFKVN
ncbi:MAG: SDR family NAD(P)-dependent oxidoreductase [Caulobacterales bacterium]